MGRRYDRTMAATEMAWLTSSETKTAAFPELSARAHSLAGAVGLVGARQLHQALATAHTEAEMRYKNTNTKPVEACYKSYIL